MHEVYHSFKLTVAIFTASPFPSVLCGTFPVAHVSLTSQRQSNMHSGTLHVNLRRSSVCA